MVRFGIDWRASSSNGTTDVVQPEGCNRRELFICKYLSYEPNALGGATPSLHVVCNLPVKTCRGLLQLCTSRS